ncbi:MAG: PLP-dependent aminotransferase family protein [Leptospirales bacterium]
MSPKSFKSEAAVGALGALVDSVRSLSGSPNVRSRVDEPGGEVLYRRIYGWFRGAILDGVLAGGSRLPPGRALAQQLGVSRNTVSAAFDQLLAEGYIEARPGSGTFVARLPPAALNDRRRARADRPREAASGTNVDASAKLKGRGRAASTSSSSARRATQSREASGAIFGLSRRGQELANLPVTRARHPGVAGVPDASGMPLPFAPGVPGLDRFPGDEFARLSAKVYRDLELSPASLGYTAPAGARELREAIAAHLRIDRGVRCEAGQIVVVNGSQQGLDLCARLLLDPGDTALVEEPGYLGARAAFAAAGARIVGLPVSPAGGLDLPAALPSARSKSSGRSVLYVTPSHQFPLGMTMSLSRRLELLEFARENGVLILEDDYDSEYRYDGRPIAALQGLDEAGESVVYLGTFSKVLAPGLRLGYLVLPRRLADAFVTARAVVDRQPPTISQLTVARYMLDGGFYRHLRRMRELYRERRETLLRGIAGLPGRPLTPLPSDTGLHVTAVYDKKRDNRKGKVNAPGAFDLAVTARSAEGGVDLPALGHYYLDPGAADRPQGHLFGFAAYDESSMRAAFRKLGRILAESI